MKSLQVFLFQFLFLFLVVSVSSYPSEEQHQSSTFVSEEKIEIQVEENNNNYGKKKEEGKEDNGKVSTHPTVKCEHIYPETGENSSDNHEACSVHCRVIGKEYLDGKCERGLCHCQRQTSHSGRTDHVPSVRCDDLITEIRKPGEEENHEACDIHCRSLDKYYVKGECHTGICNCYLRL